MTEPGPADRLDPVAGPDVPAGSYLPGWSGDPAEPVAGQSSIIPPAPVARGGALTDQLAVALAAAICAGAWRHQAPSLGLALGVVVVGAALLVRRPWMLVVGGFILASALGARSMAGMDPVRAAPFHGRVTLLSDPQDTPFGVKADVRFGHRRVELQATGGSAGTVGRALAGERLEVQGHLRPPPLDAPWLVPRHVVGRLAITSAEAVDAGEVPWQAANRFRRLLTRGAEVIPEASRGLYGGFVLGDDRGQPVWVVDDFRAAGLTHLLVVSGSNVAYLLVLASPFTRRLSLGGRWAVTLGVIGAFALVTRFEPSVLRASAMAAIAVTAALMGRPTGSVRLVALAVAALVLIDPLIIRSVGFQLSAAASLGITVLSPTITRAMPGPTWLRESLGVTLGAQLGVAPVLIPRFGGMPVVAVVANVLAVPLAGLVTTWGLPAGVIAGIAGPGVGRWLHLPTRILIDWVAGVARVGAAVPLGEIGGPGLALATMGVIATIWLRRNRPAWRSLRTAALAVAVVATFAPAASLRYPGADSQAVPGVHVRRSGGVTVLVLDRGVGPRALLEGLRKAGVRRIDVLVSVREPPGETLAALRHRWPVGRVVVTEDLVQPAVIGLGRVEIEVASGSPPRVTMWVNGRAGRDLDEARPP